MHSGTTNNNVSVKAGIYDVTFPYVSSFFYFVVYLNAEVSPSLGSDARKNKLSHMLEASK